MNGGGTPATTSIARRNGSVSERDAGGAGAAGVDKKDSALGHGAMGYAVYTFGPTNHKAPRLVFRIEAQKCWAILTWGEKTKQSGALKIRSDGSRRQNAERARS
jgi:hypothetical protein